MPEIEPKDKALKTLDGLHLWHAPILKKWVGRVSTRPSYKSALLDWQNEGVAGFFADYTAKRRATGNDVRSYLM